MTTAVKLPKSKVTVFGPPRCHQKWKEDQKKQDEKSMCARIIMRMGWWRIIIISPVAQLDVGSCVLIFLNIQSVKIFISTLCMHATMHNLFWDALLAYLTVCFIKYQLLLLIWNWVPIWYPIKQADRHSKNVTHNSCL